MEEESEVLNNSDETPPQDEPLAINGESHIAAEEPVAAETLLPSVLPFPRLEQSIEGNIAANEHELLQEQFENYLRIANALLKTLKRPKDIEICSDLLQKAQKLNSNTHLEVKRNNNIFFRYLLRVIKWTSENQPLAFYQRWFNVQDEERADANSIETRTWLEEQKSYMSSKTLRDGIYIIYIAVANDPEAGWQDGGLKILERKAPCDLF